MKTLLLNSKKCSIRKPLIFSALPAVFLTALSSGFAYATPPSTQELLKEIRNARTGLSFDPLLKEWKETYGTPAVTPLLQLASDRKLPDSQRYVALMGAAKLGGPAIANMILPLLKDSSWMIRAASLRALSALEKKPNTSNAKASAAVLPLLEDPALVVRLEAIQAVETLHPADAEKALINTLTRAENYHHQIAQWVPQRALKALQNLNAQKAIPQIKPLLDRTHDPELQKATLETLEALTGKRLAGDLKSRPLSEQIREWKQMVSLQ